MFYYILLFLFIYNFNLWYITYYLINKINQLIYNIYFLFLRLYILKNLIIFRYFPIINIKFIEFILRYI